MEKYDDEDLANYMHLVETTDLLKDDQWKFIQSTSKKYNNILRDLKKQIYGKGINTVTIPCDPDELIERMDLLIASKEADNTGVDDELQAIIKSLYKKKNINKEQLKILSKK